MAAESNFALKENFGSNSQYVNIVTSISQAMQKMKTVFMQQMQVIENTLELLVTSGDDILMKNDFSIIEESKNSNSNTLHPCCDKVLNKLSVLEGVVQKLYDSMYSNLKTSEKSSRNGSVSSAPVVLVPENKPRTVEAQVSLDSSFQVITLNSEEDYPNGSWLGNESAVEARVRVPIPPLTLLHINANCQTPEKMAITLLDYLFPRETLAVSNLSGKGKHGKKQLDPLMIYAIRCHLIHKFHITERDWYRIKQNMDSKCRTNWRKKMRGLPLAGKRLQLHQQQSSVNTNSNSTSSSISSSSNVDPSVMSAQFVRGDSFEDIETGIIRTVEGEYKVVRATREQLEKFQAIHTVLEVFSEDDQGPLLSEEDTSMTLDNNSERTLVIADSQEINVLSVDSLQNDQFIDCD